MILLILMIVKMLNIIGFLKSDIFIFFFYRISSVIIIQTSYVPDEYWQSLEVAHKMVFGYGHLTWEWKHGLRSYMYPFVFAVFYKLLKFFQLDTQAAIIIVPRVLQGCMSALSDYYFFHLCKKFNLKTFWIKLFLFTNWFWYFCGSRTVLNMCETSLTVIALYYYPWIMFRKKFLKNKKNKDSEWNSVKSQSFKYLSLVILNFIMRPTSATIWIPLVLYQLMKLYPVKIKEFVVDIILPLTSILLFISFFLDYLWYEKFTFPPFNFLVFNIYFGVATFYGSHPFYWYILQGVPVILGFHLLPFLAENFILIRKWMDPTSLELDKISKFLLIVIFINLCIFSMISHKEFRFILPLLPLMELIAIKYVSNSKKINSTNCFFSWTVLMVVGFVIPTILFGIYHQKGTLSVMNYLSSEASRRLNNSFLFLMPCHSTPLYSHLHVNVSVKFLTCEPPLSGNQYVESDDFFREPFSWLENNWKNVGAITHVICFDSLPASVDVFLRTKDLVLKHIFPHTILTGFTPGNNVLVYERQ